MGGPQGGVGFVNVPVISSEVRQFKKEMPKLLDDPLQLAEQVEQLLGPNIYTWDELQSIMTTLFSTEERQMIRVAGVRVWDQEHTQGVNGMTGEQKMPAARPQWD